MDGDLLQSGLPGLKPRPFREPFTRYVLAHFGLAGNFVGWEGEDEVAGFRGGIEMQRRAIVDDPIGAGGEEIVVGGRSTKSEDASASGFSGTRAGGSIFDDDAELRVQVESGCAFQVRLGVRLTASNVAGGDEVLDVLPKAGSTEADFGEGAGGGSDNREL